MRHQDGLGGPDASGVDPSQLHSDSVHPLRERFPSLADAPLVESRTCQYEASSDGHFLVDRHPAIANVWLVGGGSGHGFKMGPALGEHVAALVQGRAEVHPLFAYGRLKPS